MMAKTIRLLGSWWLFTALCLSLCAAYLFFTFGENPYATWIAFLFHHPLGISLYCGIIISLLAASLRIFLTAIADKPITIDRIRSMDAWVEIAGHETNALPKVAPWMSSKGFPGTLQGNTIHSQKGRLSFLPGTVFRIGLIMMLVAFLFSASFRTTTSTILHEGEEKNVQGTAVTLRTIRANLPEDFLQVGEESAFTLDRVSAGLSASGGTYDVTPGYPSPLSGHYVRIIHLGYAQPVSIRTARSNVRTTIDLDILPPGKTQITAPPSGDTVFFTFSLEPDRVINKGLLKGRQFNLVKPCYRVMIQDSTAKGKPVAVMARPGENVTRGAVSLSLGQHTLYVTLQSVHDPALPFIYLGMAVSVMGMTLMLSRFFWYRKEMVAFAEGNMVYIGYQEEFFKKWGIQHFTNSANVFAQAGTTQ